MSSIDPLMSKAIQIFVKDVTRKRNGYFPLLSPLQRSAGIMFCCLAYIPAWLKSSIISKTSSYRWMELFAHWFHNSVFNEGFIFKSASLQVRKSLVCNFSQLMWNTQPKLGSTMYFYCNINHQELFLYTRRKVKKKNQLWTPHCDMLTFRLEKTSCMHYPMRAFCTT